MERKHLIQAVVLGLALAPFWQMGCTNQITVPSIPAPNPSPTPTPNLTPQPTATFTPTSIATAVSGGPNFNLTSGVTTLTTGAYSFSCFHVGMGVVVTISGAVTIYTECFTLDAGATITGVGGGYVNPWYYLAQGQVVPTTVLTGGPGVGGTLYTGQAAWYLSGGGGHGGAGGTDHDTHCILANGGSANDDPVHPQFMGSSGCSYTFTQRSPAYSAGGALLDIVVYDPVANKVAQATVNGTIDMSGVDGCPSCGLNFEGGGGGAGGSLVLEASTILGTGLLQANGGLGGITTGAGGGGGIISLIENSTAFAGTFSVNGGTGSGNATLGCTPPSGAGATGTVTFTAPPTSGY